MLGKNKNISNFQSFVVSQEQAPVKQEQKDWQTIESQTYGYSIKIPASWKVINNYDLNEQIQGFSTGVNFVIAANYVTSFGPQGVFQNNTVTITRMNLPLSENILEQDPDTRTVKNIEKSSLDINGKVAPVLRQTMYDQGESTPVGEILSNMYCYGCSSKIVQIPLDENRVIEIAGGWDKNNPEFEEAFDKIVKSFVTIQK